MGERPAQPMGEVEVARPFWAGLAQGEIRLPRCSECGSWQWYPDEAGTDCAGGQLRWEVVAGEGTLFSAVRVHRPFLPDFADKVPFSVGLVELDGAPGVRLVAPLEDRPEWVLGSRVRAEFGPTGHRSLTFVAVH
jgi:uncharacterized OB-fold protein